MKTFSRMIALVMLVAGFALAAAPAARANGCCSSNGGCCVPSAGNCCRADASGCTTFSCKPAV